MKAPEKLFVRKRVAAYARVSCGKDAMLHSLSAQISFYSDFIQKNVEWQYAGVYCDEAVSGTKQNRPDFQRMLTDCRAGRIDAVITKSVSRFARNTLTTLQTVRELRSLGIDIFFEEQNIHTLGGDGELLLTLLAAYAQAEAESASENQKWRIRTNYEKGLPWSITMYGFRQVDYHLEIVPEEAEVLRLFADLYLEGYGAVQLARALEKADVRGRQGGIMRPNTLINLICNEKSAGDLLLQKTYISDPLEKKPIINRGERKQYFVTGSHEPIFDRDTYARIIAERDRRAGKYSPKDTEQKRKAYPFSSKIVCGICGTNYRRKTVRWHSYKRVVWICDTYNNRGKNHCASRQIPEDILLETTVRALGLDSFNEAEFEKRIEKIIVQDDILRFIYYDGTEIHEQWQNKSRRESWTPEMRQQAREHALRGHQMKGGSTT